MDITIFNRFIISPEAELAAGSARSLYIVASNLVSQGHDVHIVTTESKRNRISGSHNFSLTELTGYDYRRSDVYDLKIPSLISDYDESDILFMFNPQLAPGAGRFCRSRTDRPIVVTRLNSYVNFCSNMACMDGECHKNCNTLKRFQHSKNSFLQRSITLPFMKYADTRIDFMNELDCLFAQSPAVERIYGEVGIDNDRIFTIPNMYESLTVEPGNRSPEGFNKDDSTDILFVGRLVPEKGCDLLIDAVSDITHPFRLHMVGDGRQRKALETQVDKLGLSSNVYFHGEVPHYSLANYYNCADIFVHPGLWPDPCPRTILEALSMNLPLLVSDIGGPPWMAGDACLTFERGNLNKLSKKLSQLVGNSRLRAQLRDNTESEIANFSPSRVIDRYETIFKELKSK